MTRNAAAVGLTLAATMTLAAQSPNPPQTQLTNGQLKVLVYLPDAKNGYFRGTRFDWAGVIGRLEYQNHVYYDKWFTRTDPAQRDYDATGAEIIAGPNTAVTGPVEEFSRPQGYDAAAPGGTFVKLGVGVLKKPADAGNYSTYRLYDIADGGHRTLETKSDALTFTHDVNDTNSGYGYHYVKTVRLTPGKPEMKLEHVLRNTGTKRIDTPVYNHNFLEIDGLPIGAGYVIKAPYEIKANRLPPADMAEVRGKEIVYLKDLTGTQTVSVPMAGFGPTPADYDFRVEHTKAGAGLRITADRPLSNATLWSMRATMGLEPFIAIGLDPGQEFTWTLTYSYYVLDKK
jgi:hypothetical protein